LYRNTINMTKFLILVAFLASALASYANNECANAIDLTPNTTCVNTTGTFNGMTISSAAPLCASSALQDVWYKFTATDSTMNIYLESQTGLNHGFELIQGGCGGTVLQCINAVGASYGENYFNNNFIPEQVYYIRVFNASGGISTSNFSLCVRKFPSPSNDRCVNAIDITPNTNCVNTYGTFSGAMMNGPAPLCASSTLQDVWYKFTATDSTMSIYLESQTGLNHGFELIQGGCGGTVLQCMNAVGAGYGEYYFNNNFIPGQVYYVRVINTSGGFSTSTFGLCVRKYPSPSNDWCANALDITPNTNCVNTYGTFSGAMMNGPAPLCASSTLQDVWYKFTATDSTMSIYLESQTGLNHGFELIQAGCGGTVLQCMNAVGAGYGEYYFNNNFIPGQVYYIRVINTSGGFSTSTFGICVRKYPSPSNDWCANAIDITPNTSCVNTYGTFSGAMMNGGMPACGSSTLQDVWYKFTATDSTMSIYLESQTGLNHGFELIQGGCGGTVLQCMNAVGAGYGEYYFNNNFIPGQVYYIRVINTSGGFSTSTFGLCVRKYPSPSNDWCANAVNIIPNTACVNTYGTFSGAMMNGAIPSCASNASQDVWYKFTATDSTMSIYLESQTGLNHGFELIQGGCGGTVLQCMNAVGAGYGEYYFNNNFIPGQVYYIRVFSVGGFSVSSFGLCVRKYPSPSNDWCTNALDITPNTSCVNTYGTFSGAMMNGGTPSCAASASQDVWYKFTATDATMSIYLESQTGLNHGFELIQGGCNGTVLQCMNAVGAGYGEYYFNNNFVPGQVYYIRVFSVGGFSVSTFGLCVRKYPSPANDACANALELTPASACNYVYGTFSGAMMDGGTPACGTTASQDVWYKFTATATNMGIQLGSASGLNHGFQLFDDNCNGTQIVCTNQNGSSTGEYSAINSLVIGQTYFIRVFNASGALSITTFGICLTGPAPSACTPVVAISASATTICQGESVVFNATPTHGGTSPSYQWKVNGSNVGTNSPSYTTTTLANGNIVTCVMTSNASCASSATATSNAVTMTVTASVTPVFTQVPAICAGESFTLPASSNNGISGTWNPAINNMATTTYTFTPNTGQCALTTTMTVTVNNVTPAFTQVPAICSGGSFTLPSTSGNGISGTWSPAINNAATTTYTFTPNAGQCASTTTMTVTVNSSTVPAFTQVPAICTGGSFTLPATSGNGISGTWSPAINNTTTTTYTFTPNAGQCASATTMTVTVNSSSTVPAFTQVPAICAGGSFTLPTTSTNGISGTWSPAINNTATTTYTFTPATNQCATSTTMTVTVNTASITPAFTQVAAICSGGSFTLPATSTNGISGTWSPAINNTATTTYTFTPAAGQCATTTTMTVTVNNAVIPTFTQIPASCAGTAFTLPAISSNGISGVWSPAVNTMATTTYTFTPASGQCVETVTMTVVVNSVNAGVTVQGTTITASATGAAYHWINCADNQPINGATNASFTPTQNGSYAVTVTQNGCSETSSCIAITTLGLETAVQNGWNVYPNPASQDLFIDVNEATDIVIIDLTGKTIQQEALTSGKNSIDVSALNPGVYFIRSASGANVKFVKE